MEALALTKMNWNNSQFDNGDPEVSMRKIPFDRLIQFYDLNEITEAAEDAEKGDTIKPV